MIVIACLDDNGGMMFNHRRQSQDRMLRAHIAALVGDARPVSYTHLTLPTTERV